MTPCFAFQSPRTDHARRSRGFSLLEALIAVVVLSTGLLALAALQSALIRSSVDARIRSAAAAAAVSVFEDLRAGGYNAIPTGDDIAVNPLPAFVVPDPSLGAGGFTINYDSQAWFDNGAGGFTTTAPGPTDPPPLAEFKKIDVTVAWPDPAGGPQRSVVFTDIVGPLGANLTTPDLSDLGQRVNPPGPIVRQLTPEGPGVIPIAVGDGTETAATNPKPVIVSQGQKNTIIETRFNVLSLGDGGEDFPDTIVRIQKRVETSVVACKCEFGATAALTGVFSEQFRPTFWDGTRYVPSKLSERTAPAGPKSNVVQSSLCTECCRDHHDPSGVEVEFDPFRSGAHEHFNLVNGGLVNSNSSGDYVEACRLIRVDGIWRVATDLNDEFFGLLKTTTVAGVPAADPVPDPATTPIYEEFVIDALKARFVSQSPLDDAGLATLYDGKGLSAPTNIGITRDPDDSRWLHARGFFVDFIEPAAQQVIDEARTNCPLGTPTENCVLPFVPFTTINLTELALWSPSNANVLTVSNLSGVIFGDPLNPTRGEVNALIGAADGSTANANTEITRSNSGVALFVPVDPNDAAGLLSDAQPFTVGTGSGPPPGSGEGFDVAVGGTIAISNGSSGDDPVVAYQVGSDGNDCSQVGTDTDPLRDYRCSTNSPLGVSASVVLGSYNKAIPAAQSGQTTTVTCTKRSGNPPPTASLTVAVPMCANYAVSTVTLNGQTAAGISLTTANEGRIAESTVIGFPLIAPEDDVVVQFTEQGRTQAPFVSCEFNGNTPSPGDAIFGPCP